MRLHDPEVQKRVFKVLGIHEEDAREKFGFLLDALKSGAPPHGGIALGMDRLAMLVTGAFIGASWAGNGLNRMFIVIGTQLEVASNSTGATAGN